MGYWVSGDGDFVIPVRHVYSALGAANAVLEYEAESLEEHARRLGFENASYNDCGGFSLGVYYDSYPSGVEYFFMAVAPYVPNGRVYNWMGEDGGASRHRFAGGKVFVEYGEVRFRRSTQPLEFPEEIVQKLDIPAGELGGAGVPVRIRMGVR